MRPYETPAYLNESQRVRVNEAIISLIWCLLVGGILTFVFANHLSSAAQGVTYATGALTVIVALFAIRRSFRIRLEVTRDHIVIDNYWRSIALSWGDVTDVRLGVAIQGVMFQPAITFHLRDGRKVPAKATPYNADEQRRAIATIVALAPPRVVAGSPT